MASLQRPQLVLGIDIGTSVVKGCVADERGREFGLVSRRHEDFGLTGPVEERWWREFQIVSAELISSLGKLKRDIIGVCVAGMIPNLISIDERGHSSGETLLFHDGRAYELELELDRKLRTTKWQNEVLSKLLWLNRSATWRHKTSWILTTHAFVAYRLTGTVSLDALSVVDFGSLFDKRTGQWHRRRIERFQLPSKILPPIVAPAALIGRVTVNASKTTGIPEGVPVVAGCSDSVATLLGVGATMRGAHLVYYGTYCCVARVEQDLLTALRSRLPQHVLTWRVSIPRIGAQTVQIARILAPGRGLREGFRRLDAEATISPSGANGVRFLPTADLLTSTVSTSPKAVFCGLGLQVTRADIWRAVLESFGYYIRHELRLRSDNKRRDLPKCFAAGGGASSDLWVQIVSDIAGLTQIRGGGTSAHGAVTLAQISQIGTFSGWHTESNAARVQKFLPGKLRQSYEKPYGEWARLLSRGSRIWRALGEVPSRHR